jgi:hypothetical protein
MEVEAPCSGGAGESTWSQLGSSLAVRNVQALAASGPDELSADAIQRYIQPDIDAHAVLAEHSGQVPVIDLRKLLDAETLEAEAAKLKFACEEWGFFQVTSVTADRFDDTKQQHFPDKKKQQQHFLNTTVSSNFCDRFAGRESWSARRGHRQYKEQHSQVLRASPGREERLRAAPRRYPRLWPSLYPLPRSEA